MTSNAASFVGNIPQHYDGGLGPVIFVDYAADMLEESLAKRGAVGESGFEVLAERLARKATNRNEKPASQAKARQSKQVIDPARSMEKPFAHPYFWGAFIHTGL
jgi:hypothetical protein